MFVGREDELSAMERMYSKDGFQMLVLYGRRRVGKTTLVEQFAKGKPTLFFTAKEQNPTLNLREFSNAVFSHFDIPGGLTSFESWGAAFSVVAPGRGAAGARCQRRCRDATS